MDSYIKDLKTGNIQHTDIGWSWLFGVQHLVDTDDHPQEHPLIDGLAQGTHWVIHLEQGRILDKYYDYNEYNYFFINIPWYFTYLRYGLSLSDKLISDLHSGVAQTLEHVSWIQTKQVANFVSI